MSGRAALLVRRCFHVAVVDAPGHGDRPRTEHDERESAELFRVRAAGGPEGLVESLLVNTGRHKELPQFEAESAVRFFARHLGAAVPTRSCRSFAPDHP